MKNLARMVLFFSSWFILIVLLVLGLGYLRLWIEAARMIPAQPLIRPEVLGALSRRALPIALYCALAVSLSYTLRREIPKYMAMSFLFILAFLCTTGLSLGFYQIKLPEKTLPGSPLETLGKPGLILSQGDTVTVFLGEPAESRGSRVVSLPNRPLIYQESSSLGPGGSRLPQAPFRDEGSSVISSLRIDFSLVAREFESRMGQGFLSFGLYLGSLCILLVSLRFIFELSAWPLANLFIGALVFRGILALEVFLDSEEIQTGIGYFVGKIIPLSLISPVIFCTIAIGILIYITLISVARDRRRLDG